MATKDPSKSKPEPRDPAGSRFVQEGDEGMTFNGMSIDEYLKHPETVAALAKHKAGEAAKAGK